MKAVPELIDELVKKDVDQNKIKVVFKSQITSFQMFCFYKLFITEICEKRKSRKLLLDEYELNLCKLTNKEEEEFQNKIFELQKSVKSFNEFFDFIGLKKRSESELITMLKSAISNSERKKYHGEF